MSINGRPLEVLQEGGNFALAWSPSGEFTSAEVDEIQIATSPSRRIYTQLLGSNAFMDGRRTEPPRSTATSQFGKAMSAITIK